MRTRLLLYVKKCFYALNREEKMSFILIHVEDVFTIRATSCFFGYVFARNIVENRGSGNICNIP